MSAIIATIVMSSNIAMPSAYSENYSEQVFAIQKDKMWSLGKNLSVGDSYTFRICDPEAMPNYSAESYHYFTKGMEHNSSLCYVAKLDFVNLLDSDANEINRSIWVVQTSMNDGMSDSVRHYVLHIDSENFEVRPGNTIHPDAVRYAQSLQDTLFSILKYSDEPKLLKLGSEWGPVTESLGFGPYPHMVVLDENLSYSAISNTTDNDSSMVETAEMEFHNVYKVGYDVDIVNSDIDDVTTFYLVSPDVPFPLSGVKYSPIHITKPFKVFEFELLSYVLQNKQDRMQDDVTLTGNDVDESIFLDNDDSTHVGLTNNQDSGDEIISINTDDTANNENNAITVYDEQTDNNDSDVFDDQNIDITINTDDNTEDILENDSNDSNVLSENDDIVSNQDKTLDNISAYGVILVVLIAFASLFVYFKILRNLTRKNPIKSKERNSFHDKTIYFDDNLTINIKTKKIDANNNVSALKANDHSIGEDNK